ncbi:stage II sporulation protein M [Elizabethkingia meningoseptica]|uniref:stage II sporulation protein M n=1 Tax=Elizabethkingia meningoseptica TaxID=238 RepID=UPI003CC8D545
MKKNILLLAILTYILGFFLAIIFKENYSNLNINKEKIFYASLNSDLYTIWKRILFNNLSVVFINVIGGFSLGVLTFGSTLYNGFLMGYLTKNVLLKLPISYTLLYVAPHSFEIVGIILSCYLGYVIGTTVYYFIFSKNSLLLEFSNRRTILKLCIIVFLMILISSIIEVYVSMQL